MFLIADVSSCSSRQADERVAKCLADIRQAHDDSIESKQVRRARRRSVREGKLSLFGSRPLLVARKLLVAKGIAVTTGRPVRTEVKGIEVRKQKAEERERERSKKRRKRKKEE